MDYTLGKQSVGVMLSLFLFCAMFPILETLSLPETLTWGKLLPPPPRIYALTHQGGNGKLGEYLEMLSTCKSHWLHLALLKQAQISH